MTERLPSVGALIRILPGAIGTAEEFIGRMVRVSSTLRADLYRDDIVFFRSEPSYEAPLTREEWESAPSSARLSDA